MFKHISIAQRLWLWALLASGLFFSAVLLGWYGLDQARNSLRLVHEQRLPAMAEVAQLRRLLDDNRRLILLAFQYDPSGTLVLAHDRPLTQHLQAIGSNSQQIDQLWQQHIRPRLPLALGETQKAFEENYAEWLVELEAVSESLRLEDFRTESMLSFLTAGMPFAEQALQALAALERYQAELSAQDYARAEQQYHFSVWVYLALAVLGALAGSLTALTILTRLKRAFSAAGDSLQSIASGDLSRPVAQSGRDEFGRMLTDMALMRDSLNRIISAQRVQVQSLGVQARQMAGAASEASSATEQQAGVVSSMSAAITQLSQSIAEVEGHVQLSRQVTSSAAQRSAESEVLIAQMAEQMQRIALGVGEAAQYMGDLEGFSLEINKVLEVIQAVAEQTNLLALNAAIEAARAGEQGRGFAVVADEVRLLAKRTASSIADVGAIVQRIQRGTHDVVLSMNGAVTYVQSGEALAQRAAQAVTDIRQGSQQVIASVDEISSVLQAQVAATREIAEQVEGVSAGTTELSVAAAQSAQGAACLERLAVDLEQLAASFKVAPEAL